MLIKTGVISTRRLMANSIAGDKNNHFTHRIICIKPLYLLLLSRLSCGRLLILNILVMKTYIQLLTLLMTLAISTATLHAQKCEFWSPSVALSDSLEDNYNPFLASIPINYETYYVFWDRTLDLIGSEIVCADYYDPGNVESVVLAEGYNVTNPQVISMFSWYPPTDTLAFIFYESDQNSGKDLYYVVMTENGFGDPVPFANTSLDETHLRVSPGGGMVWQEGDAIRTTHLRLNETGFYFEPVITIDAGECRNPDIQKVGFYSNEEYIAWQKGAPDFPVIWYSMWQYAEESWSEPVLLYSDNRHSNLRFSNFMKELESWSAILVSDMQDEAGQHFLSAHDFSWQSDFLSDFSQTIEFQPDVFSYSVLTDDFWGEGYLAFRRIEDPGNTNIYTTDYGMMQPDINNYCIIDSTSTSENNPRFFEGMFYISKFDLVCIWESWRNGHSQLFTSKTLISIGNVPEIPTTGSISVCPNPFINSFTVDFNSDKGTEITARIYDYSGRIVKVIDNISLKSGQNTIKIEAGELTPGIYLLSLRSGSYNENIKIIRQ
jgi:hypothetical protein